jgi:DHA2 family multidrug resistance protein
VIAAATAAAREGGAANRAMITVSVMLATIMQALDMTIANVALPQMQGTMGATQEQIAWVLTSYIVAAAIAMPLTGFVAARIGRRRLFLWSVAGFTVASMLCGAAQDLTQIVGFRLLQGVFGASLVPLSQSVLLDAYPTEKHGQAMAMWGVGVMIGPILGPSLGGWLTEYYDWRWVFYINLPFGLLAWFGVSLFVRETPLEHDRRFDLLGYALLALSIGALQMMLDRGESLDWFSHEEIIVLCATAGIAFYLYVAHTFTAERPFLDPALFADRNFSIGLMFSFVTGVLLLTTPALLPPFMQNLLGYPVLDVGLVMAPRGVGTAISMMIVGRLSGRIDPRRPVVLGLALSAQSLWEMSGFTPDVGSWEIVRTGLVQGFGLGFIFVPLSTLSFSTLPVRLRNEGTAMYSLARNIGSSIGVSVVFAMLARNSQANHAGLASYATPFHPPLADALARGLVDTSTPAGLALFDAQVTHQAMTLAFLQDFRLIMWFTLAAIPLTLLLRPAARRPSAIPLRPGATPTSRR